MRIDGERLRAAIKACGKTQASIAEETKIAKETINRIIQGSESPNIDTLGPIAAAAQISVGALLNEYSAWGPEDESQLLQMRNWIDSKLPKLDARSEPNAVIVESQAPILTRQSRVAERTRTARLENPFSSDVHLALRAVGDSMTGAGILPADTLYAVPQTAAEPPIGSIIACRLGDAIFVKRLVTEHNQLHLVSAHLRYGSIAIEPKTDSLEILGIVIGRTGRMG